MSRHKTLHTVLETTFQPSGKIMFFCNTVLVFCDVTMEKVLINMVG